MCPQIGALVQVMIKKMLIHFCMITCLAGRITKHNNREEKKKMGTAKGGDCRVRAPGAAESVLKTSGREANDFRSTTRKRVWGFAPPWLFVRYAIATHGSTCHAVVCGLYSAHGNNSEGATFNFSF